MSPRINLCILARAAQNVAAPSWPRQSTCSRSSVLIASFVGGSLVGATRVLLVSVFFQEALDFMHIKLTPVCL